MSDLIRRQDAIDAIAKSYRYESERMTALQNVPAVEAVPVVHGEWIKEEGAFFPTYKCSVCRAKHGAIWFKYCPSCGAKMKGGAE